MKEHAKKHEFILHDANDFILRDCRNYHGNNSGMLKIGCEYYTQDICNLQTGILFKLLTMVDLSNKLKEPVILKLQAAKSNLRLMSIKSKTREETILEELPGYSFYVEAKITVTHRIKLYLHQVIETLNGKEKSTLPIAETSMEIGSMYDTICDTLWNASQEHSPLQCTSAMSAYDHHNSFRSRLLDLLEKMFNSEISTETNIHVLQSLHIGDADCSCCIQISHKMILDMGVKLYLKGIAASIIACIRSLATFGKYNAKTIIITGNLLSKWTKINSTLYRRFIWNQLEEELCLCIYQHQMKVHLIMSHTDLDLFPDEKLIKWEKYHQVVGDKRILVDIVAVAPGKLYKDEGDRYELVPAIEINGVDHWRFHLIHSDETLLLEQPRTASRFYINPSRASKEKSKLDEAKGRKSLYRIELFVCSSQDQEKMLDPLTTLTNESIIMHSGILLGKVPLERFRFLPSTEFPIVFTIGSRNYDFKMKCCTLTGISQNDESLFTGRITLKTISP